MAKIMYYCTGCKAVFNAEEGKRFKCPKCGTPLTASGVGKEEWDAMSEADKHALRQSLTAGAEAEAAPAEPAVPAERAVRPQPPQDQADMGAGADEAYGEDAGYGVQDDEGAYGAQRPEDDGEGRRGRRGDRGRGRRGRKERRFEDEGDMGADVPARPPVRGGAPAGDAYTAEYLEKIGKKLGTVNALLIINAILTAAVAGVLVYVNFFLF